MRTIYMDNDVLINIVEKPDRPLRDKIEEIIKLDEFYFVFSLWNLFEIAKSSYTQAINIAKYIDGISSKLWIRHQPILSSLEVQRYCYPTVDKPFEPFFSYLSQVFADLGSSDAIGVNAEDVIRDFLLDPSQIKEIQQEQLRTPQAINSIYQASHKKKLDCKKELFQEPIRCLDLKEPINERYVSKAEKEQLVDHCWQNKKSFFECCPIFAVENELFYFRTSNPQRIPEPNDAIDLQHQLLGLAYCDYFITHDGYVYEGSKFVKRKLPHLKVNPLKSVLDIPLLGP